MSSNSQSPSAQARWRQLPLGDLENLILKIRRTAIRQHLSAADWRALDKMRKRVVALKKEGAQS
jgi:hypothetical protein